MQTGRIVAGTACALLLFGAVNAGQPAAAADAATVLRAHKVARPPSFDSAEWAAGTVASDFENLTVRQPANLPTTAYILYDDDNVYVKFICAQPGVPIVANQSTNNVGFGLDDYVEILIDTSGVGSQVYNFYATPRGIRYQTSSESTRYDPFWSAESRVAGQGWSAMMRIPLKALRGANGATTSWRINIRRHVAAASEDFSWAYSPSASDMSDSSYWPKLNGLALRGTATRPLPRAAVYLLETAGADRREFQATSGNFITSNVRNVGADATYPITNTLALVGTLQPDYSNVEVDQQTIAPQEFPRVVNEYRPFFAQGAAYLNPKEINFSVSGQPNQTFYSPSIGRVDEGLKLEGTLHGVGLGVLQASGPGFNDVVFGAKRALADQEIKYWVNGVLANHTGLGRDQTLEGGFLARNKRSGLLAGFDVAQETGTLVSDQMLARTTEVSVGLTSQTLTALLMHRTIGPEFAPVDGLNQINDVRGDAVLLSYSGVGSKRSAIKTYNVNASADRYFDTKTASHDPQVRLADVSLGASATLRNLISLSAGTLESEQRFYDDPYPRYTNGTTYAFHQTILGAGYKDGTDSPIDFSYAFGPFGGFQLHQYDLTVQRQLSRRVNLTAEYAGTVERMPGGTVDGQNLRRVSISESIGTDFSAFVGLRAINGNGGFASPGTNLAFGLHRHSRAGELHIDFGSPASPSTLNRFLLKYVLRFGGGEGT